MSKDNVGFIHIAQKSKIMERRLYHLLHQPALAHSCHFQSPILPQPHILQVQILPTRLPFQVQIMRLQPMRVAPYTRHQLHNIPPPSLAKVATPNLGPTQHGLQSRYGPGTEARADIDYQTGCNCVGKDCCYRGHKCDQSLGAECGPNIPGQCATLRLRFIAQNPCC